MRKTTEYDKINSEKYRKEIETMRKKTDLEAVKETLKLFFVYANRRDRFISNYNSTSNL